MISGLKLSIRTPLLAAELVGNAVSWSLLKNSGWSDTASILEQLPERLQESGG